MMFEGIEHRFCKAHKVCDCGSLINEAMLIKCDKVLHTWSISSMKICLESLRDIQQENYRPVFLNIIIFTSFEHWINFWNYSSFLKI